MDPSGIVIGASFRGGASLEGHSYISAGEYDGLLIKLGAGGEFLWGMRFGDGKEQSIGGVAMTPWSQVLVTGAGAGTFDLGGPSLTIPGGAGGGNVDVFLAELTP